MLNPKRQNAVANLAVNLLHLPQNIITEERKNSNLDELPLEDVLLNNRRIDEEQKAQILAALHGYRYQDIELYTYSEDSVRLLTSRYIERHHCLCLERSAERAIVAISDPEDYDSLKDVRAFLGVNCQFLVASDAKIQKLKNLIFSKSSATSAMSEFKEEVVDDDGVPADADVLSSPSVKLIDNLIRGAISAGASDIHIEPFDNDVRVRYRIDGKLQNAQSIKLDMYPMVCSRIKIMGGMNIAEKRAPQDGRAKFTVDGVNYDLRISSLPNVHGEKIVMRILDTEHFDFKRANLHFLPQENKIIDELITMPHGIVLLTGPTGSGKSTTLYSFIKEVNSEGVNIITVEDPVEYTIDGVNQTQVNNKAGLGFAPVLRSILRQDPDIVMIGEIRDEETAEMAIRMAITGHLVFSTLHTNDAAGAISRLIDLKVQPFFVADALSGVIAQRLLRKLCPFCKKPVTTSKAQMRILQLNEPATIYEPCGCPKCRNTGYKGRLGVHEILQMTPKIKEMILTDEPITRIREEAINEGMLLLEDTARQAVLDGETDLAEFSTITFARDDEE